MDHLFVAQAAEAPVVQAAWIRYCLQMAPAGLSVGCACESQPSSGAFSCNPEAVSQLPVRLASLLTSQLDILVPVPPVVHENEWGVNGPNVVLFYFYFLYKTQSKVVEGAEAACWQLTYKSLRKKPEVWTVLKIFGLSLQNIYSVW